MQVIYSFLNAYSEGISGGDMVFLKVAPAISKDFEHRIITSKLGKKLCTSYGIDAEYEVTSREEIFKNVIWIYLKRTFNALKKALFEKNTPDLCLGTSDFLPDVLPCFLYKLKNKNIKWVQHIFHLIPKERLIPYLSQRVSLFIIKKSADMILVDNSILKESLVMFGFAEEKIKLNYPGIDFDKFQNHRNTNTKGKVYDAVFLGRLKESKGIYDFIPIWEIVTKSLSEATLGVIGKGDKVTLDKLESDVKGGGLEKNIKFLGFIPNDKTFSILRKAKVFVFPSHEEGFGIAPLEAQACGVPVVAWHLPVFEEIFPEGMIKVKSFDYSAFAKEVVRIIDDSNYRDKLSKESVSNAKRLSWENTIENELSIIRDLI